MRASVIISTYNSPLWLEKVLWGYSIQTVSDFEVIIADDGSTQDTKMMIEAISEKTQLSITHVWHKDEGFQKTMILNKAILASKTDYCIFTDGDCIPRMDFVETHLSHRSLGCFLSGGYFKLPISISKKISKNDILNQDCFDLKWLKKNGLGSSIKNLKLAKNDLILFAFNMLTPTKPSWNGHNSSTWKKDIISANGFNNDMKYGGEDREFGERLINAGMKARQIRFYAICVHLEHKRGYVNKDVLDKNKDIRLKTKIEKQTKTPNGIQEV
ncbi:glycosyltransferase family 2 protein [Psychroflexus sp. CAK57W]|uniref:glycosyltransferase family 2 protein n=1 Tax=Psychroflexus curvus TaxID=2873595 RepID=UPI001CCA7900|nr:glycosyltransferase family 2 protein [Psychroflexus curvus]MBZ9788140.1 glycosyltransferase family 2 protein [Psychroflexus curvus]